MHILEIQLYGKLIGIIGFARKSAAADIGFEAVRRSLLQGKAAFVLVDHSLTENSLKKIVAIAEHRQTPVFRVQKNQDGIDLVGISGYKMLSIHPGGLAKGFIDKLTQELRWL